MAATKNEFPSIIRLNVGGTHFTTALSTLRKYENSMLAAMFSGRHHVQMDEERRYFIDSDPTYFLHILTFLRREQLPPTEIAREVAKEAQYYGIDALVDQLNQCQPLFGELIGRQEFVKQVPNYRKNLEEMISIAKEKAFGSRETRVTMRVFKEPPETSSPPPDFVTLEHTCTFEYAVSFGPWDASPGVKDLVDCIALDLKERRFDIQHQKKGECYKAAGRLGGRNFCCERQFFEFTFKWW
ncbi:BTB/POZ domain-containing protein KCTD7-like isoform X1 [Branchiostoma floridae x Branchiostoma belcheri]